MSTHLREASVPRVQLETVLPEWCALKWQHCVLSALLTITFLYLSYIPVSSPQTWLESTYGTTFQSGVPVEINELLPLSVGIRHQTVGWAGHSIIASLNTIGGPECIGLSYALFQIGALILWSTVLYRLCKNWLFIPVLFFVVLASYFEYSGFQSGVFGQLCFASLAMILVSTISTDSQDFEWNSAAGFQWILVIFLFAAWANLHASVVIGVSWLFCFAAARGIEVSIRRQPFASIKDVEFQRRVWLFEIALVATLLNPIGIGLWKSALWWPDNPFIQSLGGWSPTLLASWTGLALAIGWGAWITINRQSDRRSIFLTISIVSGTVAVALMQSSIIWFAPVMAMAIAQLLSCKQPKARPSTTLNLDKKPKSFQFAFTLITGLFIWLGFCLSPSGSEILGGQPRSTAQILSNDLPQPAKLFLSKNHPAGLMFSPSYWTDWIQSGTSLPSMANSNFSLVPNLVSEDYQKIYSGKSNWRKLADKYSLTDMLVDKSQQSTLVRHLRRQPGDWKIAFEDNQSIIFRRQL